MTISGLCIFLDITLQTWTCAGFADTQRIDEIIRTQKFEGAAAGLLDVNLIAREMAMMDPPGSGNPYDQLTDEELDQELCGIFQSAGLMVVPAHQIGPQKLLGSD
jgi:hypothetical protein